jgi:transcriptional regulator with XRE-family HTH domain
VSYASEADLYADAVRLNIAHGLALTSYHVRVAIARLEQSGFTREQISDVVKMTVEQIEKVERGFASNQAGEAVALKGGLRNLKGETLSAEQLEVNRRYSGPKAIFHVRQIIQLLRNDMWPRNEDFITEMNTLAEVWKELVTKENKAA